LDERTLQILQETARYFSEQHQQAYLVGGSLRNLLLGEPCVDWDIATHGDTPMLTRRLADRLGGHYAHLNTKASRVVVPWTQNNQDGQDDDGESGDSGRKQELIIDVSPLKGKTIELDLRQRDFTINAIAAPLNAIVQLLADTVVQHHETAHITAALLEHTKLFIDPLHGISDLKARRLKAVDSEVFRHDPLRMLRAVRLMAHYSLKIDGWTEGLLMRDAPLITQVAPERIREEFYAILAMEGATERLRFLDDHGLLTTLFPDFIPARGMRQPNPHYWDVLEHSMEAVGMLEKLTALLCGTPEEIQQSPIERSGPWNLTEIQVLLQEAEQQGVFQRAMLSTPRMKMATLLHDIGKPPTYTTDENGAIHFYGHPQTGVPVAQHIMRRLSTSTQDNRLVQQVVAHHMRPGQLGQDGDVTLRAIRRYFVDLGPAGIAVALLSLADHLATRGPEPLSEAWDRHLAVVCQLLEQYIRHRESIMPQLLISSGELMRRLKLEQGPIVGTLLEAIAEAQTEGTIHSKDEAFWLAEEKLHQIKN
jgi:poly(A) polymerase